MTDRDYHDLPFDVITQQAEKLANKGALCFQKFTCEACGNRLMIEEPNKFYTTGSCDRCGHNTNIKKRGCGYMIVLGGKGLV